MPHRTSRAPHPRTPSNAASRRARKASAGPCPIMHACGGCAWLGMPYTKQLARKQEIVDALFAPLIARMGWGIAPEAVLGMRAARVETDALEPGPAEVVAARTVTAAEGKLAAPRAFRYKAATPFAPGEGRTVRAGFFAAGTHRIVPAPDCAVEAPGARRILNEVARIAGELGITAYNEDTRRGLLRHAVLRLGWRSGEGLLTVVAANRDVPRIDELAHAAMALDPRVTGVSLNVNTRPGNAIWGPRTYHVAGDETMRDELLGCTFEISPGAFYQTNPAQTEVLYQLAVDGMDLQEGEVLLDAYCGSGTIGIVAAREAADAGGPVRLVGVERNSSGIADARRNARLNGFSVVDDDAPDSGEPGGAQPPVRFVAEDATSYLRRAAQAGEQVDVLCLDPPRAGSTPEFLDAAGALAPRRIVYVSCNPVTQVRDLEHLGRAGYALERIVPVDMFPHTEHIETVAVLARA